MPRKKPKILSDKKFKSDVKCKLVHINKLQHSDQFENLSRQTWQEASVLHPHSVWPFILSKASKTPPPSLLCMNFIVIRYSL